MEKKINPSDSKFHPGMLNKIIEDSYEYMPIKTIW